jgi:hypothetical protein
MLKIGGLSLDEFVRFQVAYGQHRFGRQKPGGGRHLSEGSQQPIKPMASGVVLKNKATDLLDNKGSASADVRNKATVSRQKAESSRQKASRQKEIGKGKWQMANGRKLMAEG